MLNFSKQFGIMLSSPEVPSVEGTISPPASMAEIPQCNELSRSRSSTIDEAIKAVIANQNDSHVSESQANAYATA